MEWDLPPSFSWADTPQPSSQSASCSLLASQADLSSAIFASDSSLLVSLSSASNVRSEAFAFSTSSYSIKNWAFIASSFS